MTTQKKDESHRLLPLQDRLQPDTLSAALGLHGGRLQAAEQQPVSKVVQMWTGQVTRLLLQEGLHGVLTHIRRGGVHHPGSKTMRQKTGIDPSRGWLLSLHEI